MTAFECAIQAGADMIETDVHLTKDEALVLIHDDWEEIYVARLLSVQYYAKCCTKSR